MPNRHRLAAMQRLRREKPQILPIVKMPRPAALFHSVARCPFGITPDESLCYCVRCGMLQFYRCQNHNMGKAGWLRALPGRRAEDKTLLALNDVGATKIIIDFDRRDGCQPGIIPSSLRPDSSRACLPRLRSSAFPR